MANNPKHGEGVLRQIIVGVLIILIGTFITWKLGWNASSPTIPSIVDASENGSNISIWDNIKNGIYVIVDSQFFKVITYVVLLVWENVLWIILVFIFLALPAPYYAMKLIRRNRSLGRDIYREIAQADRFMQLWIVDQPVVSSDEQYIWAFVPNHNPQGAHYSKIDAQLAKMNLIQIVQDAPFGGFPSNRRMVKPVKGVYLLRNWMIFLLLLFLRVTFFGDRFSHISTGGGRFESASLEKMYWATAIFLIFLLIALIYIALSF